MILSALLTSVGINLGLCILFFTLYSILRKQPGNADVYAPLLVIEGKSPQRSDFNLERLLRSTSWVRRALQTSEEELLLISGLDAVVFMRIFIFRLWIHFSAAYVFTAFVCYLLYSMHQRTILVRSIPISSGSNRDTKFEPQLEVAGLAKIMDQLIVRDDVGGRRRGSA